MNRKSEEELQHIIRTYGNLLYRNAYVLLRNPHDVQDVLQEVMLKYMEKAPVFQSTEHEKAWLLKVTSNLCKDFLRFNKKHSCFGIEELEIPDVQKEYREILREVLALPAKYKSVLILHYIEGYQLKEVAGILGISENAAKKRIQRGREALKLKLDERQADACRKEVIMNATDFVTAVNGLTMPQAMKGKLLNGCQTKQRTKNFFFRYSKLIAVAATAAVLILTASIPSYAAYDLYQTKNVNVFFEKGVSQEEIRERIEQLHGVRHTSNLYELKKTDPQQKQI